MREPTVRDMTRNKEYLCRSSIALNNIGVELLGRRCPRQAYDTLKAAVQSMRIAFLADEERSSLPEDDQQIMDRKVAKASRSLSCPRPVDCPQVSVSILDDDAFLSDRDSADAACRRAILHPLAVRTHLVPLRIQSNDHHLVAELDPDVVTTLVMYNFALSHMSLAATVSEMVADKLYEGAIKLLSLVNSSLMDRCRHLGGDDEDDCHVTKIMFLACLALSSLYQVLCLSGRHSAGQVTLARISKLRESLQVADPVGSLSTKHMAPSA